mgnify:CR=1 FL=1
MNKSKFIDGTETKNDLFRDCQVSADNVADFLLRFYKSERYHGRGEDYAAALLASHEADFANDGFDVISRHDSVTGKTVAFYGPFAAAGASGGT